QNGGSALTIDSIVANQGGQGPTVNQDRVVYNSTPGSATPTYSAGTSIVEITSAGPILLNSISATGAVTIKGESIVEGSVQSQNIVAPCCDLSATGTANYQGQVTFANSHSGDRLTLPSTGLTWTAFGFAPNDSIIVSGASAAPNDATFTVASISADGYTLI